MNTSIKPKLPARNARFVNFLKVDKSCVTAKQALDEESAEILNSIMELI